MSRKVILGFGISLHGYIARRNGSMDYLVIDNEGEALIPSAEPPARRIEMTPEELGALLSGIDLSTATRRKRYRRAG